MTNALHGGKVKETVLSSVRTVQYFSQPSDMAEAGQHGLTSGLGLKH